MWQFASLGARPFRPPCATQISSLLLPLDGPSVVAVCSLSLSFAPSISLHPLSSFSSLPVIHDNISYADCRATTTDVTKLDDDDDDDDQKLRSQERSTTNKAASSLMTACKQRSFFRSTARASLHNRNVSQWSVGVTSSETKDETSLRLFLPRTRHFIQKPSETRAELIGSVSAIERHASTRLIGGENECAKTKSEECVSSSLGEGRGRSRGSVLDSNNETLRTINDCISKEEARV